MASDCLDLRKRVAFERLLARLQAVAPDAWALKGGFALELRLGAGARTTKDMDLDWMLDEDDAVALLLQAATIALRDRFEYNPRATHSPKVGRFRGEGGYPSDSGRTMRRWLRWAVWTIRGPTLSFGRGFWTMGRAWTTWTGCVGRRAGLARCAGAEWVGR